MKKGAHEEEDMWVRSGTQVSERVSANAHCWQQ
jgi:hypothetical protein